MDEQDQWLTLYIILFFVAFISGLALLAARSQYRRNNAYEPWHARLAAAEGKPRHAVSKTSTSWVSDVLLSVVALAAIVVWAIFFRSSSSDLQISATLRDIQAAQQQTTSGTKPINDSNAAVAQGNTPVAELLNGNATAPPKDPKRAMAGAAGVYKGRPPSVHCEKVAALKAGGWKPSQIARKLGISRASVYRCSRAAQA
jgi:type II secretory pathway pseudopilin PulG